MCVSSSLRENLEGPFGCTHRTEYTTAATGFAQGQPRENAMDIVAIDSAHKLYTQSYVNRLHFVRPVGLSFATFRVNVVHRLFSGLDATALDCCVWQGELVPKRLILLLPSYHPMARSHFLFAVSSDNQTCKQTIRR